ncbi:MAG: prepilin-type N-terminal cleavage/methylation domain-containing protein [Minisyncoccia bacterium]
MKSNKNRGFTLIEMIVVVGIIGIITGVVFMSLDTARSQSRDKKRIGDVKSIQLALEIYYLKNKSYPDTLAVLSTGSDKQLPSVLTDPNGGSYNYVSYSPKSGSSECQAYHLGTILENDNKQFRDESSQFDSADITVTCGSTVGFDATSNDRYYDVTPKY